MIYLTDGNIPLNAAYDDNIIQEANSIYQLSFKFPTNNVLWQRLREETFLTADDLHAEQDFVIFEVEKKNGFIQVYANQVMTLLNNYVIGPLALDRVSGSTALSQFSGSITRENPFSFFSDIDDRHTFNTDSINAMAAFTKDKHSILGQWGGDLVRHGYQVKLLKNGGSENESLFMYQKNLSNYQQKTSTKSLKTRITFKKTIKSADGNNDERKIAVVVDSPLINKYSQIYEDVIEVTDQNVTDESSLREYGKQYFRTSLCDMIEENLEISVVGRGDVAVQIFDTVSVFHEIFNLDVRKKITKYTYAPMSKKLLSVGFGNFKTGLLNMVSSAVREELNGFHSQFETQLSKEIQNADLAFDRKVEEIKNQFEDEVNAAKATAEENKRLLSDEINNRFSGFDSNMNEKLEDQRSKIEEIRAIGSTVGQTAEEALEEARNALESANTSKGLSDSNFAKIEQITDRIKTLVTKQEVDPLTDRLRIAESRIEVQADQITERLTRTDFDRLANDRGFQNATQVQNTVRNSVDGFQRTISRIETKLRDVIRNDNLLQNSSIIPSGDGLEGTWALSVSGGNGRTEVIDLRDAPHNAIKKGIRIVGNTNGGNKDIAQRLNLTIGEKYTMSCWARVSSTSTSQNVNLLIRSWTTNETNRRLFKTISNKDWVRYQLTFTADAVYNSIQFGQNGSGSIEICGMKLERSDRMTDYDVNSSEIVSVIEFNDVRDTVSSHTQTLQRQDQAISQVIQTADGLVSRVSNFLDDFNLVYDPTNFSKWTKKQPEANVIEVQADTRLLRITTTGKNQAVYHGFALPLNTSTFTNGEKLSYRMEVWVDVLPDAPLGIELWNDTSVIASDRVTFNKTGIQIITGTMTVNKKVTKTREFPLEIWLMKNGQVAIGQVSLIRGDKPPKKFSDNTSTQDVVTQTQVSQLNDSYAIQTLTGPGSISSQINLNSNNILIEAAKIRLKGRTLLDEITAIDGYFKRLFVGDARIGTLNTDIIRSNSIAADKLIFDTALAKKLVSSDVFTDTLAAKTAFINKLRSVVVSATLLEGYKGRIGGFQIGTHDKDPTVFWLTGSNSFRVGMSDGGWKTGQTALWVNWGNNWEKPGDYAWFVKNTGEMHCYNKAQFWNVPRVHGNLEVTGDIFYFIDRATNKVAYWVSSPSYKRIEESNGYAYLYRQTGGYSWVALNKDISDRRYKTNIEDSQVSALDVIKKLKTYSYRKEYDEKVEDISCGIMAQDVQKYAPEAFFENPDGAYSYNTFALVPYLIKAIQELNQKVERLETT